MSTGAPERMSVDPAPRWFEESRTVVEWKDGSETVLDYNAQALMEGDRSRIAPKSWRVEQRRVTNWREVER
jgi:hypothetical protein